MLKVFRNLFLPLLVASSCYAADQNASPLESSPPKSYHALALEKNIIWPSHTAISRFCDIGSPRPTEKFYDELVANNTLYKHTHRSSLLWPNLCNGDQTAFIDFLTTVQVDKDFKATLSRFSKEMTQFVQEGSPIAYLIYEKLTQRDLFMDSTFKDFSHEKMLLLRQTCLQDFPRVIRRNFSLRIDRELNRILIAYLTRQAESTTPLKASMAQIALVTLYYKGSDVFNTSGFKTGDGQKLALKYGETNSIVADMVLEAFLNNKLGFHRNTRHNRNEIFAVLDSQAHRDNKKMQIVLLDGYLKGKFGIDDPSSKETIERAYIFGRTILTNTDNSPEFKNTFFLACKQQWKQLTKSSKYKEEYLQLLRDHGDVDVDDFIPSTGIRFTQYADILLTTAEKKS